MQDLISLTDALRHPVVNGDRVLTPLAGVKLPRGHRRSRLSARIFAPGQVLKGHEKRNEIGSKHLQLRFVSLIVTARILSLATVSSNSIINILL